MNTVENGFDWFTGSASFAARCPPGLARPKGLLGFFVSPNDPDFGTVVPRVLMHECLHAFQLAGSRWLQRMVAEEWERVLAMERTGNAPPLGPLRRQFARPASDMPFSVRDLVECLARFWDMHVRGPDRVLEEEAFPDPHGYFAAKRLARRAQGTITYTHIEYDAAMKAGMGQDSYPRLYLWMLRAARDSPAVKELGKHDPSRNEGRASWAVNVLMPVVSFIALNTADPVRAFVFCVNTVLGNKEGLFLPTVAEDPLIELDQLATWQLLVERLSRELTAAGLPSEASLGGPTDLEGWREHPVWRYMPQRFDALRKCLTHMLTDQMVPKPDPRRPWQAVKHKLLREVLHKHAFAACALMGLPEFRPPLGIAFAPPVLHFSDRQLAETESATTLVPWPLDGTALTAAVDDAVRRHRALRNADFAAKFNIQPDSFRHV